MIEGFTFTEKTIEGYEYKATSPPGTADLVALQAKSDKNYLLDQLIDNKYSNLPNKIIDLSNNYNSTYKNTNKYNIYKFPDKTDMVKTTTDVREEDINTFVLQQNYIYVMGTITCATLLIAVVIISK